MSFGAALPSIPEDAEGRALLKLAFEALAEGKKADAEGKKADAERAKAEAEKAKLTRALSGTSLLFCYLLCMLLCLFSPLRDTLLSSASPRLRWWQIYTPWRVNPGDPAKEYQPRVQKGGLLSSVLSRGARRQVNARGQGRRHFGAVFESWSLPPAFAEGPRRDGVAHGESWKQ